MNVFLALNILNMFFVHYFQTITDGPHLKLNLSELALKEMVMPQFKKHSSGGTFTGS